MIGIISIIINAAILSLIMFAVARHEADYYFPKVALISLGLGLCQFLLSLALGPGIITLVVILGLTVWSLHQFCYLRWSRAGIVTGIHIVLQIALLIVLKILAS